MKASEIIDPAVLEMPFAVNGDKNNIPVTNLPSTGDASQSLGFPPVTQVSVDAGGIPPDRKDFNGLGYLTTSHSFYAQNGNFYTFSEDVSSAIGGYPLGAKLWYTDDNNRVRLLKSAKDDNTDNFLTNPSFIGTSWVDCIPTQDYIDTNFINNNERTNCITGWNEDIKIEWNAANPNKVTVKAGSKFYVPNGLDSEGTPDFKTIVTENDLQWTAWNDSDYLVCYYIDDNETLSGENFVNTLSGSSKPASSPRGEYFLWWDTANNVIQRFSDNGSTVIHNRCSLPLFVFKGGNNVFSAPFRVFNGYGVCGSTYFTLPGLKLSLAMGHNDDGSVKNYEVTNKFVYFFTRTWVPSASSNSTVVISAVAPENWLAGKEVTTSTYVWWYNNYFVQNDEPQTKSYTVWYNPSLRKTFYWGASDTWTNGWIEFPCALILFGNDHDSNTEKIDAINGLRNPFVAADASEVMTWEKFQVVQTLPSYAGKGIFYFCTNS